MGIVHTLRIYLFLIVISLLIAGFLVPDPSWARQEARYEGKIDGVIFGNDLGSTNSIQTLFHQQTASGIDSEALHIDFPPSISTPASKTVAGSTNLAYPSISQTVDQSYSASDTGFYQASFLGIPPVNFGASPVTMDAYSAIDSVSRPPTLIWTSMFPEMVNIIPGYNRNKAISSEMPSESANASTNQTVKSGSTNAAYGNQTTINENTSGNSRITMPDSLLKRQIADNIEEQNNETENADNETSIIPAGDASGESVPSDTGVHNDETISGQEILGAERAVPLNATGQNAIMYRLSYPYYNFKAKPEVIGTMSLLDRMWRNSHLGTMGRAYEGDTSYPEWILPMEYTKSAIALADWSQVNNDALNYTLPGTYLTTRFWDLGINSLNDSGLKTIQDKLSKLRVNKSQDSSAKTGLNNSESQL